MITNQHCYKEIVKGRKKETWIQEFPVPAKEKIL